MTLIELLMAAAIGALLLGTVIAVYVAILNTVAFQSRWRAQSAPAVAALDLLIRDLSCAAIPLGTTNRPFTAGRCDQAQTNFTLNFYSAFPTGNSNDWRRYSLSRVGYALLPAGGGDEFTLVRESVPGRIPSGNPAAAGREQWPGIKKMELAFYDGASWTNQWGRDKNTNVLPQAVRIKIIAGAGAAHEFGSEVVIPAGRRITAPPKK